MNIPKILEKIRPGAAYSMVGYDDYAKLEWFDTAQTKPTLAEIQAAEPVVKRQTKIKETKTEAFRRILIALPSGTTADNYRDKELNLLARSDELHRIVSGTFVNEYGSLEIARSLTTNEIAELTLFSSIWTRIKAIRVASNLIEADIAASTDPANFDVTGSFRWPS